MNEPTIQAAMDACRPGSDDLHLPEMQRLADALAGDPARRPAFGRLQRIDGRMAAAMQDVAVPSGLAERILARVEAAKPLSGGADVAVAEPTLILADDYQRASRRHSWLRRVAAVAAVLLVSLAAWTFWPHHKSLSSNMLLAESGGWYSQLVERTGWTRLPARSELPQYPLATALRTSATSWADASDLVGRSAVAYELAAPAGRRATLFVIPASDTVADSAVPLNPQSSTGGMMIGCWQSGGMIYVLVVEGDERTYQSLLDASPQPLA